MPHPPRHDNHLIRLGTCLLAGMALVLACQCASAASGDMRQCGASGGALLVGQVVSAPKFKHGMHRKGVELSHTHLKVRGGDGKIYDVAIDNVFASGYRPGIKAVPAPLDAIAVGDKIEACGIPYRGGMHWVHNNCGDTPTRSDPDGWLKVIQPDGRIGRNLEANQTYCHLWPRR
ncbi:MAG: hypothetical protein ACTHJ1_09405 [Bordetella sp.]|uniref:hypothetical protein n=1 Tax=Bordetella sp. TaxID=28081 RepID=UPI003F7C7248